MSHDIEDLLEMIRALEERIIELETAVSPSFASRKSSETAGHDVLQDSWYWNHG